MSTAQDIAVDPAEATSIISDDLSTYTQSLRSSIVQGVSEHGRRYHSYGSSGYYLAPEDAAEQERLELQHEAFRISFNDQHLLAPVKVDAIKEVLDLGTGTGTWAIEYADAHPDTSVTGTDLSAIQPSTVPPNCKFIIDDFEETWVFGDKKFDVVHGRMLVTSYADPAAFFKKCHDALAPGGWVQMEDLVMPWRSDDDTVRDDSAARRWGSMLAESIKKGINRDFAWPESYAKFMEEAGFINVSAVYPEPATGKTTLPEH
jgi:trans-aconitate methyltransferase